MSLLTWRSDTFGYAEAHDEDGSRYQGLQGGNLVSASADSMGLLVKPEKARQQLEAEIPSTKGG